jgi:hypothetical protein
MDQDPMDWRPTQATFMRANTDIAGPGQDPHLAKDNKVQGNIVYYSGSYRWKMSCVCIFV